MAWVDYDGDGDLDCVLGNLVNANDLYRNDGSGIFTLVAGAFSTATDHTYGLQAGDVDNDGDLDLVFLHMDSAGGETMTDDPTTMTIQIYRTESSGTYAAAATGSSPIEARVGHARVIIAGDVRASGS